MKKLLITLFVIVGLVALVPVVLIATGTINSSSVRMVLNVMAGVDGPAATTAVERHSRVPAGFHLTLYAGEVPKARFMRFTPSGDLLVSRPHNGDIVRLGKDIDADGHPDQQTTLIDGLDRPQGMDFHGGWLYIAERTQVGRVRYNNQQGTIDGDYEPVITGLTGDGNHWSKTLRFGTDGMLYLSQGSTCNVCVEEDERRATMMRFAADGSGGEIIATGLRNSVGFDWAPWNGALYATDNGRDLLGDNFPGCELNLIEAGKFYGWPYYNGNNIGDPDMGDDPMAASRKPTAPAHEFAAHNAPLGMTFLAADGLPQAYQKSALVALHGSWNRSIPDGYKVVLLQWRDGRIEEHDFLTGFNQDGEITGRPVDVTQGPDGAIYVSDDYAGAIYRIEYNGDTASVEGELNDTIVPVAKSRLDATPPQWLADMDIEQAKTEGEMLFKRFSCGTCHERSNAPVSLDNLADRLGYAAVIQTLQAPKAPMPIYPLNEQEQKQLAVYLLQGR